MRVRPSIKQQSIIDYTSKNSSNYNVEYRDGIKSKGDKIGMPCRHSTVI